MGHLNTKSDLSFISAELLKKEGYHHSSIHCSYYGLFQKMKYTIKNHKKITYEEYYQNSRLGKLNSHAYLIDLIYNELILLGLNKTEAHKIRRKIIDLKELRETADYDNIKMNSDNSNDAYDFSLELIKELKNNFKI